MKPFIKLSLGVLCIVALLLPQIVFAAGTPAGTVISNYATMNYKDLAGNSFPAFNSNTVTVIVARLAGIDLSPPTAAKTVGDSLYVYYPFTVTNTGNSTDTLLLSSISSQGWSQALYHDINNNGVLDSAELAAGPVTVTDSVKEDSSWNGIARIFVPFHTLSGTVDHLSVTAESHLTTDTTRTGIYTTTISTGVLSVTKNVSPTNPKPGDQVTYTVNFTNSGTGAALSTVITDVLDNRFTYVNGSISPTPTGDSSKYISASRTVAWYIGKVPGLGSGSMTFKVKVNDSIPYHTIINNKAKIDWIDSTNNHPRKDSGNSPPIEINQITLGAVYPDTTELQTVDVGLKAVYPFYFHNLGNGTDSLSIAPTTTLGLSWTYYVDANNNDSLDGGDYVFSPAHTPAVPQDSILHMLAVSTIPTATADKAKDSTTFVFTFLASGTFTDTVYTITTIRAPLMVMSKAVVVVSGPSGLLPVPGAILEYTISYSDTGTGASGNTVVTDSIPTYTTYQANTVVWNAASQTDAPDGDHTTANATLVTVNVGHVNAGGSGTVKFRVKIN